MPVSALARSKPTKLKDAFRCSIPNSDVAIWAQMLGSIEGNRVPNRRSVRNKSPYPLQLLAYKFCHHMTSESPPAVRLEGMKKSNAEVFAGH